MTFQRTTRTLGTPGFVVNRASLIHGNGRQIDWAQVSNDFKDATTGKKLIKAGTVMHELPSGKIVPRTDALAGKFILVDDAYEASTTAPLSGYGIYAGGYFYETLLPQASGNPRVLDADIKTELGPSFLWDTYKDVR